MGASALSSRAIIGEYYKTLEEGAGMGWFGQVSNLFESNQPSEVYKWLGQVPQMREWIGGRQAKGFTTNGIEIQNLKFESTLEVDVDDLRRDKTGQVLARVRELARRTNSHWTSLGTQLVLNGASQICYDGQYFFDTDHSEGASGAQSNSITVDISALPTAVHGTPAMPSVEEMQLAITTAVQQMVGFVDDQGEPFNEDASGFLVLAPVSMMKVVKQAVATPVQIDASQTAMTAFKQDMMIEAAVSPRLSSWSDKFVVFRTDSEIKPFIRQNETDVEMKAVAEGSELEFNEDKHRYGVTARRNVGYGLWQHAVLAQMV